MTRCRDVGSGQIATVPKEAVKDDNNEYRRSSGYNIKRLFRRPQLIVILPGLVLFSLLSNSCFVHLWQIWAPREEPMLLAPLHGYERMHSPKRIIRPAGSIDSGVSTTTATTTRRVREDITTTTTITTGRARLPFVDDDVDNNDEKTNNRRVEEDRTDLLTEKKENLYDQHYQELLKRNEIGLKSYRKDKGKKPKKVLKKGFREGEYIDERKKKKKKAAFKGIKKVEVKDRVKKKKGVVQGVKKVEVKDRMKKKKGVFQEDMEVEVKERRKKKKKKGTNQKVKEAEDKDWKKKKLKKVKLVDEIEFENSEDALAAMNNLKALSPKATFSACLLIRDDNEILPEWIAYHYHVLKLRDIIVAVDPNSKTSPSSILKRWKKYMHIEEWTDENFMPQEFLETGSPPDSEMNRTTAGLHLVKNISSKELGEISSHRYRQRVFLARCVRRLKKRKKTWTVHIDTDEFVVSSKLLRQMGPKYIDVPPIEEPGSVLSLLQNLVRHFPGTVGYPCITVMRILFGSVESLLEQRNNHSVIPEGFNATRFETTRWRYHAHVRNKTQHGHGKVIMDISAFPGAYFEDDAVFSIHRPVPSICRSHEELMYSSFMSYPLSAAHYLGSWERYSGRDDKRRSREIYDLKANVRTGEDDGLRPWLKGFVKKVGEMNAVRLLPEYLLTEYESSHNNGAKLEGSDYQLSRSEAAES